MKKVVNKSSKSEKKTAKKCIVNQYVVKQIISPDNVLEIAEMVAITQLKFLIRHTSYGQFQKMLNKLFYDLYHINDSEHSLSDSYDIVQIAAAILCQHYGKRIYSILGYTNKGKMITVQALCIKEMNKYISLLIRNRYRHYPYELLDFYLYEEESELDDSETYDYTEFDKIIDSLNPTENMRIAVNCRMNGLSYPEIGKVLNRTQSTVYEYFIKLRQRYIKLYSEI